MSADTIRCGWVLQFMLRDGTAQRLLEPVDNHFEDWKPPLGGPEGVRLPLLPARLADQLAKMFAVTKTRVACCTLYRLAAAHQSSGRMVGCMIDAAELFASHRKLLPHAVPARPHRPPRSRSQRGRTEPSAVTAVVADRPHGLVGRYVRILLTRRAGSAQGDADLRS